MVTEAARARSRAYALMESAQGDDPGAALAELAGLRVQADRRGWPEVALLADAGQVLHAVVVRSDPVQLHLAADALVAHAEAVTGEPVLLALALALRAVTAAAREDSAALTQDAGRALALAEDDALPALDRCMVLVVCAAAYNSLSLWELVDELYDRAAALAPSCEEPLLQPAVVLNRAVIRLEWATALFELGEDAAALEQLDRAVVAVRAAAEVNLPPTLWRLDLEANGLVAGFVLAAYDRPPGPPRAADLPVETLLVQVRRSRDSLRVAGDVEVLPLLDALLALGLLRLGRGDQALRALDGSRRGSSSSGSVSFAAWVRARALTGDRPDETVQAHAEYGVLVARSRAGARAGMLVAARSRIMGERVGVELDRLSRDVLLDPLTGLSNQRCFDTWLASVPDRDQATALLLIDMDEFKVVNDVHGHAVGDEVLRRVGRLVAGQVRPGDLALRLGGDEFAVVLTELVDPGSAPDARAAVTRLRERGQARARALRDAVAGTDWSRVSPGLSVRLSLGIAVGDVGPHAALSADGLYRLADTDLYVAKAASASARAQV